MRHKVVLAFVVQGVLFVAPWRKDKKTPAPAAKQEPGRKSADEEVAIVGKPDAARPDENVHEALEHFKAHAVGTAAGIKRPGWSAISAHFTDCVEQRGRRKDESASSLRLVCISHWINP